MNFQRGDVVLAWYPFSAGTGGKRRPCLIVQNDIDNARLTNTIVVQITSDLRAASLPTHFLIRSNTPEGRVSGLLHDSLISCSNIATIEFALIDRRIGSLPQVDASLKAALQVV